MGKELRFDGRVAVITGAGNGLGRSHALLFGARGARVVVNDLGGGAFGGGNSSSAADQVVAEIQAAGGEAVANYDSVEEGEKIVQTALDAFGRIDILVNNAGILRDISFAKMTREDWDLIQRVHLEGTYRVTHAAWPHLRDQEYGRVIATTSAAGIYGNFGQANYSAAKLGILGLAQTLALEGRKRNIFVNTIAPIAGSRLTETVLPPDVVAALQPKAVSVLVAYLCHESCTENGSLFEVGGGFFAKLRWQRAKGKIFRTGRALLPESIQKAWETITSFDEVSYPSDVTSSMAPIMNNIHRGPSSGGNEYIDVDEALGYEFPESSYTYDERDAAIYALGVGAAKDPTSEADLQLVYEMHNEGFRVLPTFGVIPGLAVMLQMAREGVTAPGCYYGLDRLLHGEQFTEVKRPMPRRAKLTNRTKIVDIFDKGENALMITETRSFDEAGEELVVNRFTAVIRGAGGWGGERGPSAEKNVPPARDADAVVREVVDANQALIYRLSGDWNPLHADPNMARAFGFEKPILHGLCTYGYVGRHVINTFATGDPRFFRSIQVRFADSVYPGETLVTEMWQESATRIIVRASVAERDEPVITQAAVELYEEIPQPPEHKPSEAEVAVPEIADEPLGPQSQDIFVAIAGHVETHPEIVERVQKVFQFSLVDPTSDWFVDLKTGQVAAGKAEAADCALRLSDADFMAMCSGEADAQKLFFGGQLQISGNVMASQELEFLKDIDPATVLSIAAKRSGSPPTPAEETAAAAPADTKIEPRAPELFARLAARLAVDAGLARGVDAVVQVDLEAPEGHWTLDFSGAGVVSEGNASNPDATLILSDQDLVTLWVGDETAESLFQKGRLRIDGDILVIHRLDVFKGLSEG